MVKCCILYILFIFSFNTLDKGLDLLSLQLKWLEWKNNGAELSTTDIGLYNGAEFRQSSGFMLSMVKQLESPWNLAKYVHLPEVGTFQVSISVTKS